MANTYIGTVYNLSNVVQSQPLQQWWFARSGPCVEIAAKLTAQLDKPNTLTSFGISLPAGMQVNAATPQIVGTWTSNPPAGVAWRMSGIVKQYPGNNTRLLCISNDGPMWQSNQSGEIHVTAVYKTT